MASSLKQPTKGQDGLSEAMEQVKKVINVARKYQVTTEVIATAMLYLQQNPGVSIGEALGVGLADWDI
jgi:hypothetical protein